jgi:predicted secreted protein with PEFG-CTERM motif
MKFLLSFFAILFFSGMIGASYAYTTPEFIENYEERWSIFTATMDVTSDDSFSIIGNSGMNDRITVTIIISSPMGNIVSIDQITPDSSGDYSTNFKVGKTWIHDGAYDISVFANKLTGGNQKYDVIKVPIEIVNSKILQYDKLFDYDIDGAYVTDIKISEENNSIIISINSDSDGNLTVYLPREVIDAKIVPTDNASSQRLLDGYFTILTDGTPTKAIELQTAKTIRIISIDFENGTSEIEIIGTKVIPEFGTIAMIVLAVAIVSIITVSTKSRLRFIPQA